MIFGIKVFFRFVNKKIFFSIIHVALLFLFRSFSKEAIGGRNHVYLWLLKQCQLILKFYMAIIRRFNRECKLLWIIITKRETLRKKEGLWDMIRTGSAYKKGLGFAWNHWPWSNPSKFEFVFRVLPEDGRRFRHPEQGVILKPHTGGFSALFGALSADGIAGAVYTIYTIRSDFIFIVCFHDCRPL